ncbi:MAG: hypothetical protein LWW88_12970 [Acinetobacter sp.]|uniref:phage tail assembly protein T n=1 Tax=Acinetobacter sp. TaxID=472 RepID=UPI002584D068|nr:hypothetical protein [Acinetobacter sp.]MCE1272439.1 hypothetical protein [Acinetobacter sp.]
MGRTVGELQASLSIDELRYWYAFDQLEPVGVQREDILFARLAQSVRNPHLSEEGQEYNTLDRLMIFNQLADAQDEADYELSVQESVENVMAFFSAMKV